jgi:hypothetical protein
MVPIGTVLINRDLCGHTERLCLAMEATAIEESHISMDLDQTNQRYAYK